MADGLDMKFMMDPTAMCGLSLVQDFGYHPSSWPFCKGAPSLNFRTGALTQTIAMVYKQWVKSFTPATIVQLNLMVFDYWIA